MISYSTITGTHTTMIRVLAFAVSLLTMLMPTLSFSPTIHPGSTNACKMFRSTASSHLRGERDDNEADQPAARADKLVTELLERVDSTDRGAHASQEQQRKIDSLIEQLSSIGEDKDWLSDGAIFGNYNVAYVSKGSAQEGNPAGGRFRSRVGKGLLRTEDMFQHLITPSTAINMVAFRVFGLFPGCVTLRGAYEAIPDRPNFVKASFDPPLINFFGKRGLTFRLGPRSSVALQTTYLDERVRIGKGGRGSLFVFSRGGRADMPAADLWTTCTKARSIDSRLLGALVACSALACISRTAFVSAGFLGLLSLVLVTRSRSKLMKCKHSGISFRVARGWLRLQ